MNPEAVRRACEVLGRNVIDYSSTLTIQEALDCAGRVNLATLELAANPEVDDQSLRATAHMNAVVVRVLLSNVAGVVGHSDEAAPGFWQMLATAYEQVNEAKVAEA